MFKRLFRSKSKQDVNVLHPTLDKLNETLESLEAKEKVLSKKVANELCKAKEYSIAKNKRAALQCLKRDKLYESQIEKLGSFQMRIHDQMIMLEAQQDTADTVGALRTGSEAMKAIQKKAKINDVDKIMDEITRQNEDLRQVQDVLSRPVGGLYFDEDELEAELEELEELEKEIIQKPAARVTVPSRKQPANNVKNEDADLAELQLELKTMPIPGVDFDDVELEAELDELEKLEEAAELEEHLLKPATRVPVAPVKSKPRKKVEYDVDELAELQKELAFQGDYVYANVCF